MPAADVTITILVDNQAAAGLVAEHGLSLEIVSGGQSILFDTGQGSALARNARLLDVDLRKTSVLVLSHGHYDHTGGIPDVLRPGRKIHVFGHPAISQPRYSIRDGRPRAIAMPPESAVDLGRLPWSYLHWVQRPASLTAKIGVTGPIPRETTFEDTGGPFYLDPEGRREDPILDDLALWIQTDDGLVVCVGCCHAGLINTLQYVRRLNRGQRLRAVIGGFHLLQASDARLDRTAAALRSLEPDLVVPCHCTGDRGVAALRAVLGERVSPGEAGKTYLF